MANQKKKSKTHTGQTKVVGRSKAKIGDTPYVFKRVKGAVEITGGHRNELTVAKKRKAEPKKRPADWGDNFIKYGNNNKIEILPANPDKKTIERMKALYKESMKHPASAILKSVREDNWKKIEKDFKLWANDSIDGSLCYYSDNQIREILIFFKKRFVK